MTDIEKLESRYVWHVDYKVKGTLTMNEIADCFALIEKEDNRVVHCLMNGQEELDALAKAFDAVCENEEKTEPNIWGAWIHLYDSIPKNTLIFIGEHDIPNNVVAFEFNS